MPTELEVHSLPMARLVDALRATATDRSDASVVTAILRRSVVLLHRPGNAEAALEACVVAATIGALKAHADCANVQSAGMQLVALLCMSGDDHARFAFLEAGAIAVLVAALDSAKLLWGPEPTVIR